jgi:hypothetical protein
LITLLHDHFFGVVVLDYRMLFSNGFNGYTSLSFFPQASGGNGTTSPFGLLLLITRPSDKYKCALCLPPSALRQV